MGPVQAYLVHPDAPQEAMPASGASQLQRLQRWGAPPRYTQSAETTPAAPLYDKNEVNYRYAADPAQACGKCVHFDADTGSCELVEGLIRTIDTCDKFEAGVKGPRAIPGREDWSSGFTSPGMDSSYDDWYAGGALDLGMSGRGGSAPQCAPEDQDSAGRCPDDPNFDEFTVGMWGGSYDDGGYGYDESAARGPVQASLVGAG